MKQIMMMVAIGAVTLFASCKKEGCTDIAADNYDEAAEVTDGSCSYSADVVLYLNEDRHEAWLDDAGFFAPFHFFVDGEEIGELSISNAAFETHETPPNCEGSNGIYSDGRFHYTHTMDSNIGDLEISIEDQLGNAHGSLNINLWQGDCKAVLL